MLNVRVVTRSLAVSLAVMFVVCVLYGLVVPPELHGGGLLGQLLPGFHWITPLSFLLGLVETFLYGAFAGLLFGTVYNSFYRRLGPA
jgi:hypothetical protein